MILITGSEGLIGKTLINKFNQVDIDYQRFDIALDSNHPGYGDICNSLASQVDLNSIEGVIHLAAISRVVWGQEDPNQCWLTNAMATFKILNDLFRAESKPWILYASSREVYGQQTQFPVTEQSDLLPLNHYASSKLSAEKMVNVFKKRGLRTQILRLSSVYGRTDDHPDRVMPAFCRAAAAGESMRIDGRDNVLDFTHVDDVADGFLKTVTAMREKQELPSAIHLTTGKPTTLYETALMARDASGNDCEFIDAPPRNYDVSKFYAKPLLAKEALGWRPTVDIKTGIGWFVEAFTKELAIT